MTVIQESEIPSISMPIKAAKQSLYRPVRGPKGFRRLRLPDFKTFGTCRW